MAKPKKSSGSKRSRQRSTWSRQSGRVAASNNASESENAVEDKFTERIQAFLEPKAPSASATDIPTIAAQLLEGDNYERAAKRAFELVDACRKEEQLRSIKKEIVAPTKMMPFSEAVHFITGLGNLCLEGTGVPVWS